MPCCPIVWCLPEYLPNCLWWKKDEAFWSFFNMKKKIKQKWSLIIETLVLLVCMFPPLNDILCNLVWIFWRENILVFLHFFCRKKQFWHMNLTTWLCFSPQLWKCLKKCAIPWRNDFLISWFLITYFFVAWRVTYVMKITLMLSPTLWGQSEDRACPCTLL